MQGTRRTTPLTMGEGDEGPVRDDSGLRQRGLGYLGNGEGRKRGTHDAKLAGSKAVGNSDEVLAAGRVVD